jgi:hypothetical protein
MLRLVIVLAILALGYWYWSGHRDAQEQSSAIDQPSENAIVMKECLQYLDRESATEGLVGFADGGNSAEAERLCAAKNHLAKGNDGLWHRN